MDAVSEEVYSVIRDVLDLTGDVCLDRYSQISGLVEGGLEPIYLLEILHRLGINAGDYCTGERLNDTGFGMLVGIVLGEGKIDDIAELCRRFRSSIPHNPIIDINDLAGFMNPAYLEKIMEYDSAFKKQQLVTTA